MPHLNAFRLATAAALLLAALVAVAAPILPGTRKMPGSLQSLAGLKEADLRIVPLPPQLRAAGIREERIREVWRQQLEEAGIELKRSPNVPVMLLGTSYYTSEDLPGVAAVLATLTFKQSAHVSRLGKDLDVPTYTLTSHVLAPTSDVERVAKPALERMVEDFIGRVTQATDQLVTGT